MVTKDERIQAKVIAKLHRNGCYTPRAVPIDAAASWGAATHDRGLAKELIAALANDDSSTLCYKVDGQTVTLVGSEYDVALEIAALAGKNAVPWDIVDEL